MTTRQLGTQPSRNSDTVTKAYIDAALSGVSATVPSYVTTVGDNSGGPFTITHNLGTRHVRVVVYRNTAPYDEIIVRIERTTLNTVTLVPEETWSVNQYRVLVTYVAASDTTAPTAGVLSFSSATSTSITYTFTAGSDNVGVVGVDAYDANTNALVASNISSPWTRGGLNSSTSYGTYLKYRDAEGNTATSSTDTHSTAASSDTTAPTPGTASVSSKTSSSITYAFTAGSDNVGVTQVDAYDANGTTLLAANVTSPWTRTGLSASTSYGTLFRYRDAAGNTADSTTVTTTTNATAGQSFVDAKGEKTTTSLSVMPTHQTGDILLMFAYRDGFNTPPSLPSGWTDLYSTIGTNTTSMRVAYKVATSSSEVSGTWTNATDLTCESYRGFSGIGAVVGSTGTTDPIVIPALTLQVTDGSSWVACGAGHRSGANSLTTAPSGLTYRAGYDGNSNEQDTAAYDTNGGVASFASKNIPYATTSGWMTASVELKV